MPTTKPKIHYSGGITYERRDGGAVTALPGWPACVSGVRARRIRAGGERTDDRDLVTCLRCRNLVKKRPATAKPGSGLPRAEFEELLNEHAVAARVLGPGPLEDATDLMRAERLQAARAKILVAWDERAVRAKEGS